MSEPRTKTPWGWWLAAGLAICLVAAALRLGLPIYRRNCALATLRRLDFTVSMTTQRPRWLVDYDRWRWTDGFESVDAIGATPVLYDSLHLLSKSQRVELRTQIREFGELMNLGLLGTGIEDADLVVLDFFPNLESLNLGLTSITEDALRILAGSSNLRVLILRGTQIDDPGLLHLARLTKLERLDLDYTRISNTGLKHLSGLPNLRELSVSNTAVTDAGLDELLKTHPALSVSDD